MSEVLAPIFPIPLEPVTAEGISIGCGEQLTRFSLRTRAPQGLPTKIGTTQNIGEGSALCLGPDEWMLLLPDGSMPPVIAGLSSITDISHRSVGLHLSGAWAARLIQSGCPLDLSLPYFPVGKAVRTVYDSVEIILWRKDKDMFHIEVWRSFAPYLWSALTQAAQHRA
jgi:sarcosine oxidase, subunit gamma